MTGREFVLYTCQAFRFQSFAHFNYNKVKQHKTEMPAEWQAFQSVQYHLSNITFNASLYPKVPCKVLQEFKR